MIDRKSILKFFYENNFEDAKVASRIRNFYTIFSIIEDQKYFDAFIKDNICAVRNPYKNVYPIQLNEEILKTVEKRIIGSKEINVVNDGVKLNYCNSVIMSAIIFRKMGYSFSEDELNRIRECCKIIEGVKNIGFYVNPLPYSGSEIEKILVSDRSEENCENYRNELRSVLEIVNDDEETIEYIHDLIQNISEFTGAEAMFDITYLVAMQKVYFNEIANTNCSKIKYMLSLMNQKITSSEELENDEEYVLSYEPDFIDQEKRAEYDKALEEIYLKAEADYENGDDFIYSLYKRLNEAVVYNTLAFSWDQRNRNVEKIINNDKSKDINSNRNEVTCHTWSRAMVDLLDRSGYEAYIVGDEGHQFVLFFDEENNAFVADGTNPSYSDRPHGIKASDIARAKLGLDPTNFFMVLGNDEYLYPSDILYKDGEYMKESDIGRRQATANASFSLDDFKDENGQYDYSAMIKKIDDNPKLIDEFTSEVKSRYNSENIVDFINDFLKGITKGHEDDDLLLITCVSNLVYMLKKGENTLLKSAIDSLKVLPVYSIDYSDKLYKKTETRTKFVPLIYTKTESGKSYFLWDDEEGFVRMPEKEIIEKINSGEVHSSTNNGSKKGLDSVYVIPGMKSPKKSVKDEENAVFDVDDAENGDGDGIILFNQ